VIFILWNLVKKTIWGFAGKRVVQGTISEPLPDDFQSASHVITTGAIDMIAHRRDQKNIISNLATILLKKDVVKSTSSETSIYTQDQAVNQ
jgi:acetyl-CoA carboxylase carboxyl transferase subunit beta